MFLGHLRCLRWRFLRRFLLLPDAGLSRWRFFPQFRGFRTSFGAFCSFSGIFHACACIPWLHLWCCLFALYASPTLRPPPAVAGFLSFSCGPPPWLSLRVCVGPFGGGGAVSSFSPPARLLLSHWLEFASVPLPAAPAVFPRRVLPQVTLRGLRKLFWLQLPDLLLRWSSVCWVCGVFGAALGFPPCAVLFFRGLRFWAGCPSGFLPFLSPYAWPTAALVA